MSEQEGVDRMRLTSRSLPVRHGDDSPVPQIMMLTSDHEKALAAAKAEKAFDEHRLSEAFDRVNNQIEHLSEKDERITRLVVEIAAANEQIEQLRQENANLQTAIHDTAVRHGWQPQSSKSPLGSISATITEQAQEIDNLRCALSDEQGANGWLKDLNANLSKEIERLTIKCDEQAEEISGLRAHHHHAEQAFDENAALKARIETLEKACRFVCDREDMTFAECSLAEAIVGKCRDALTQQETPR